MRPVMFVHLCTVLWWGGVGSFMYLRGSRGKGGGACGSCGHDHDISCEEVVFPVVLFW